MLVQTPCTLSELLWLSSVHLGTLWVITLKTDHDLYNVTQQNALFLN